MRNAARIVEQMHVRILDKVDVGLAKRGLRNLLIAAGVTRGTVAAQPLA